MRRIRHVHLEVAAGLLLHMTFCAGVALGGESCRGREAVTEFGAWFSPNIALSPERFTEIVTPELPGLKTVAMRLLIAIRVNKSEDWNLVLRDPEFHVLATLGPRDFPSQEGQGWRKRWTGTLPAEEVIVDLKAKAGAEIAVNLESGIALPSGSSDARLFSIQDTVPAWKGLYDIATPETAKRAGDVVGMFVTAADDGDGNKHVWCCSGVMLSSSIVMTNWHCGGSGRLNKDSYWNGDVQGNAVWDLGFDDGPVRRQYSVIDVITMDQRLDFALLRVQPVVGLGGLAGEPVRAEFSTDKITKGEQIFVVHHASCSPKLLSANCRVVRPDFPAWLDGGAAPIQTDFTHNCDTEPGASGAPVFDHSGKVIGLHHFGFKRNDQCEAVDSENKAVRITEIVDFIKRNDKNLAQELGWN